jgi:hypothetical protein
MVLDLPGLSVLEEAWGLAVVSGAVSAGEWVVHLAGGAGACILSSIYTKPGRGVEYAESRGELRKKQP